ncbi:MAG TPA: glycosyltransferase family 39 protein [Anaerolineales bacterium]|nr:glycosyltransferase family 39 protein [Anaerolineales bacterium]
MMKDEETELQELAPWFAIVITLIGGALRVLLLDNKGLRFEETFSLWVSSHDVVDMLQWIAKIDQHPPLYYLLLHYWTALNGDAPSAIRQLSVLFGAGTIPLIYLIGKRMSGAVMGLVAAVILAFSPFNIRLAQETRMYTLLMFNASVAIYALVWLLTDTRSSRPIGSQFREYLHTWRTAGPVAPGTDEGFSYADKTRNQTGWRAFIFRHRWSPIQTIETDLAWVAFIVFSAATLLTHNTAVLFLLATNFFVLGLMLYERRKKSNAQPAFQAPSFWNWVKAQVGILLLWSPWVFAFIKQAGRVYQEFWIQKPDLGTVIQTLAAFLNTFAPGQAGQVLVIWILYALVLCLGLVQYRKKISVFLFLVVLIVIPFLGELVVSLRRPIFLDRTLIWTTIPLFLVLAAGIVQLRFRLLIIVVLGILGTNNLFSASDYYRSMQAEDWSKPAGFVAKFVQNGDLILFNATAVQIPFDYYFIPYEKQYFFQVEKRGFPVNLFDSGIREPEMTESDIPGLVTMLNGHKTVWLVYSHNRDSDPMGLIPQTLAAQMKLVYQRDFSNVQVQIYATP